MSEQTPDFGYGPGWIYGPMGIGLLLVAGGLVLIKIQWQLLGAFLILLGIQGFLAFAAIKLIFRPDSPLELPHQVTVFGNENVLDIGCGSGRLTIAVARRLKCGKITGVDTFEHDYIRENSPELAGRNAAIAGVADRVEFIRADVLDLPFDDETFDLAVSSLLVDHLGAKKNTALAEVHRVIKPRGCLFLMVHVRNLPAFLLLNFATFFISLSRRRWLQLLNGAGFNIIADDTMNGCAWFLAQKRPVDKPVEKAEDKSE
jgi:SAM-dependent methyltransferase